MTQKDLSTAENLFDFFHHEVEEAVSDLRVPVSEDGVYYITNLLVERGHSKGPQGKKLVDLHLQAQKAAHTEAVQVYRELGDQALYMSGFFRHNLRRGPVGLRYYQDMGAGAYDTVSRLMATPQMIGGLAKVFSELASAFEACSEALCKVQTALKGESDQDIIALYELWLLTGDEQAAKRLRELGVDPQLMAQTEGDVC